MKFGQLLHILRKKNGDDGIDVGNGRFKRAQMDYLSQVEKRFKNIPDLEKFRDQMADGGISSLDVLGDLLEKNRFNSSQVDVYYKVIHKKKSAKYYFNSYLLTAISFVLFFASLYILIAEIPPGWKGARIFYFNYYDALTMSDLFAVLMFFTSSLIFIRQMFKLFNK